MKGIAAPLAALEGNALPLAQEGAEGEESASGEGFDALLALVNAQAPNAPAPVKVLAPSVGVQCAPVAANKGGQPSAAPALKSGASSALDIAPTQVFLPWLGAQAPVASEPSPLTPETGLVAEELPSGSLPALASDAPVSQTPEPVAAQAAQGKQATVSRAPVSAQPSAPELPVTGAKEPALKSAPLQRKSAPRAHDERAERLEVAPAPTPQNLLAPQLAAPAPSAPKPTLATVSSGSTSVVSAPAAQKAPASMAPAPLADTQPEVADVAAFGELLAVDQPAAERPVAVVANAPSREDGALPLQAQREPAAPQRPLAPAAQPTIPLSDPETQARVTKIEFFSSAETPATSAHAHAAVGDHAHAARAAGHEPRPAEAQPGEVAAEREQPEREQPEREQPERALADQREPSADGERKDTGQQTPDDRTSGEASSSNGVQVARFEVTEGKGMRGLDAVVASLLRPYAEKPEGSGGVRVPTAGVTHISVETGKSQNVKTEERVANVSQVLDAAALRRQEEERRGELRELGEPAAPHFTQQLEPQADLPAEPQAAQNSAPVNVPAPSQPDPDAAMMGKIARGESLNAAVSIEHPELGSMDVLVQNENGRIDVRATLETPRAAAVLRAHESALRYGVQQAGMTFGALRVNARTGEMKIDKSRDVPKRRRERDWEA